MKTLVTGFWKRILGCFLAGLLAILPLVVTVAVVIWVAGFLEGFVGPGSGPGQGLRMLGLNFVSNETLAYALGWLVVLAAIFLLGVLVQLGAKRLWDAVVNGIMKRIPLAGSIYSTATQLVGMLDKSDKSDLKGMSVVYCSFGGGATGMLALLPTPDRYEFAGRSCYAVYLPTSPVPMTGGLLFVPVEDVHTVNMTVDGLMSIYLSMGITAPQFLPSLPPTTPADA